MITVEVVDREGAAVVEVAGRLDPSTCAGLRDRLLTCAVDEPTAIVVHLTRGFTIQGTAGLAVFATVRTRVSEWPGVPVVVVADDEVVREALAVSGVARSVPRHPTVRAALDAVGLPRERRGHEVQFPYSPSTPRLARAFVRDTCARWDVLAIVDDAVLVVSELVENAIRHARSAPSLRLELRPGRFAVVVRDSDPTPPKPRPLTTDQLGGRGMPLVEILSRA